MTNNFPGIGYKTQGRDFNFYQLVNVTATTFGGSAIDGYQPDLFITFSTTGVMFLNEGTGTVEYSFNGQTVHGELASGTPTQGLTFDNRVIGLVWFRIKSGSSGPIAVSVQAWSIR